MPEIKRYTAADKAEWNAFLTHSKNGTFLFHRDYMDYHSDRFHDHSLMVYDRGHLCALLPANDDHHSTWWTHQGLTYGGLVMDDKCRAAMVCNLFAQLNDYLRQQGFSHAVYKRVPWTYCRQAAEEDAFALFNVCHATIRSRDVSSVVMLNDPLPLSELRRRGERKAQNAHLRVCETAHLAPFWQLLEDNLKSRFNARPVHTLQEAELLRGRFPENIRLFVVMADEVLLGGTLLYIQGHTVKTQYISANEEGRSKGALDLLFSQLLSRFAAEQKRHFDFGTSNRVDNDDLNETLIFQKEGFGGRAVCYDSYEWTI